MKVPNRHILAFLASAAVLSTALMTLLRPYGPRWIWTGCMDPGPDLAGCASVVPVGAFATVILSVLILLTLSHLVHRFESQFASLEEKS